MDESDPLLDKAIDDMLNKIEREGESYDQCFKAMQLGIGNAMKPMTIQEWVAASQKDRKGRTRFNADVFQPAAVKNVVLKLIANHTVLRLGRQTFCPRQAVYNVGAQMQDLLFQSAEIMSLEDIAKHISASKKIPDKKVKLFCEEKIMRMAADELDDIIALEDGSYVHNETIETCVNYLRECIDGMNKPLSHADFFSFARQYNVTGMDNQYQGRSVSVLRQNLYDDAMQTMLVGQLHHNAYIEYHPDLIVKVGAKGHKYRSLEDE